MTYHTVTINGQKVQIEDGKTIARPVADPIREGYKFIGWYVGDKEYDFDTPVTSDLIIEARWEKISTTDPDGQKPGGTDTDQNDDKNPGGTDTDQNNDKKPGTGSGDKDKVVKTGDIANPAVWAVCLMISVGATIVVLRKRIRK